MMSIIISRSGRSATKLDEVPLESEQYLQRYIYENPQCLPLDEYKEDVRLVVLAREFPTPSGPIDALAVDQDGEVYVIETKLYRNPDKRRVLAQVLDYGASLWRGVGKSGRFVERLREVIGRDGADLEERIEELVGAEGSVEDHLSQLQGNVSDGSLHFVVLMDRLDERLKDLIAFMNEYSRFDVFGVELEFYRHDELEILVPKLYGAEIEKSVSRSGASERSAWDETSFFEDAASRLEDAEHEALRGLWEWSREKADRVTWGTGARTGSFNAKFDHVNPKSVFSAYSDGTLCLNFAWLDDTEESRRYARRLGEELQSEIPELGVPEDFVTSYVSLPADRWTPRLEAFVEVLERAMLEAEDLSRT